jgi:hypothetical protein
MQVEAEAGRFGLGRDLPADDRLVHGPGAGATVLPREAAFSNHRTLDAFLGGYIAARVDARPNTVRNINDSWRKPVTCFGADQPWDEITAGDADDWRPWTVNPK